MIRCYTSHHSISRMVMAAFADGCGGQMVPSCDNNDNAMPLLEGDAALYGILRGCGEIYKRAMMLGRNVHYIDHGYINFKGHQDKTSYYRIARNGRQSVIDPDHNWPSDRFEKLGVELKPWRKSGRHVLVIPLTEAIAKFHKLESSKWLADTVRTITHHTERPILTKPKGEGQLEQALADCWCVVTHSSNVAVDALIEGVPVITLGESTACQLAWNFPDIERPYYPERDGWAHGVAYQQWTLSEMRRGVYAEYAGIQRRKAA